jgi:hypothetical protein
LDSHPEAASITGMHLRNNDSRMFCKSQRWRKISNSGSCGKLNPVPDCVGATRRYVIEEWLNKSHDYFALEAHSWLTFSLKYAQLYVDEPWTLYHVDSPNSATLTVSGRSSQRVNDCLLFLDDHDQILKEVHRRDVDLMLEGVIFVLLRNYHWHGFKKAFNYLRLRSTNPKKDLLRIIINRVNKKLVSYFFSRKNQNKVFWV